MRSGPTTTRLAAFKLCSSVLFKVNPLAVDVHISRIFPGEDHFVRGLVRFIGHAFNTWGPYLDGRASGGEKVGGEARIAARESYDLAMGKLRLIHTLARSPDWSGQVTSLTLEVLDKAPKLLSCLVRESQEEEGDPSDSNIDRNDLDMLVGVLSLMGGVYEGYFYGCEVKYRLNNGQRSEVEEGIVLKVSLVDLEEKSRDDMEGPEEVITILPKKQGDVLRVPLEDVSPQPFTLPDQVIELFLRNAPSLLSTLEEMVRITQPCEDMGKRYGTVDEAKLWATGCLWDLRSRFMKSLCCLFSSNEFVAKFCPLVQGVSSHALMSPAPIPVEPAKKYRVFESKHPYDNNTKQTFEVQIRGATGLSIAFDPQSRTETGCDFLVFYKDRSKREKWGMDKFSGRDYWPGCGGRPPLEIPASSFVLFWYSDASNFDWGWRFTVTATMANIDVAKAPIQQIQRRLYHLSDILYEMPRTEPLEGDDSPLGLFEQLPELEPVDFHDIGPEEPSGSKSAITGDPFEGLYFERWPQKYRVLREDVMVTSEPAHGNKILGRLAQGEIIEVVGQERNWMQLHRQTTNIIRLVDIPNTTRELLRRGKEPPQDCLQDFGWDASARNNADFEFSSTDLSTVPAVMHRAMKLGLPDVSIVLSQKKLNAGKWFWEVQVERLGDEMWIGITDDRSLVDLYHQSPGSIRLHPRIWAYNDGSRGRGFECAGKRLERLPEPYMDGDFLQFYLDVKATTLAIFKNGILQATHTNLPANTTYYPFVALDFSNDAVVMHRALSFAEENAVDADAESRIWTLFHHNDKIYLESLEASRHNNAGGASWVLLGAAGESTAERVRNTNNNSAPELLSPSTPGSSQRLREVADEEFYEHEQNRSANDIIEYSPRYDLKGQLTKLWRFSVLSYQAANVRFASKILLRVVGKWPEGTPFSVDVFGSFQRFWQFLALTYGTEHAGTMEPSDVSTKALLAKICNSLRSGDRETAAFVRQILIKSVSSLKDTLGRLPKGRAVAKVIETPHPYLDNMDTEWRIHFPGAKKIKIVFDPASRTETNCDWVIFYR